MTKKFKVIKPIRYLNERRPVGSILELDEASYIKVFENKPGLIEEIVPVVENKPEPKKPNKPEPKPDSKDSKEKE